MLTVVTDAGLLKCLNNGTVDHATSQDYVRIANHLILVESDTVSRSIKGCTLPASPGSKPCTSTVNVVQGYSSFVRIRVGDSLRPICLHDLGGMSDGIPAPQIYKVVRPGQDFVKVQV
jgi:hypothetical protein